MPQHDATRAPSFSRLLSSTPKVKLPLLFTARPGNVGIQIDAHRTMNLHSYPRSIQFTSRFHGKMFENGSLENYSRSVTRSAHRERLLQIKLEKLQAREQYLMENQARRRQRCTQREAMRQRRLWRIHHATKHVDQQAKETAAAVTVQRVIRGALARRAFRILVQIKRANQAAVRLQQAMKMYMHRERLVRQRERLAREVEEHRELEMHSIGQRQVRKRVQSVQEDENQHQHTILAAFVEDEEEEEDQNEDKSEKVTLTENKCLSETPKLSTDQEIEAEALRREISLDLLFSDEEDNEMMLSRTVSSASFQPPEFHATPPQRPRRPMSVRRVGGGYRVKLLANQALETSTTTSPSALFKDCDEYLYCFPRAASSPIRNATNRNITT